MNLRKNLNQINYLDHHWKGEVRFKKINQMKYLLPLFKVEHEKRR